MRGVPFQRVVRGGRAKKGAGLCVGRATDTALNRHVTGECPYSAANPRHARLGHVLRALRARGVVLVRAQVPVAVDALGIHTTIDAVGVSRGALVVVELKCTAFAKAAHRGAYETRSTNNETLANGLPNNEQTLHRLQAGFGVAACRQHVACRVEGVVVVAYADCADVHEVPRECCNTLLFAGGCRQHHAIRSRTARPVPWPKFDAWPEDDARVEAVVRAHGGDTPRHVDGGVVVVPRASDGAPMLVAGCMRRRWHEISAAERRHMVKRLLKSHLDVFGAAPNTRHVHVLLPHGKHWRLRKFAEARTSS